MLVFQLHTILHSHLLLLAFPFPNIACSFYWPNPFSTIIVADLIKCFSTEVAESTELTPNRANSAFETIGVTSLGPNQANQGMTEWIGNKMVNFSQSVLNLPSQCGNAQVTHMTLKFKKKLTQKYKHQDSKPTSLSSQLSLQDSYTS